MNERLYVTHDYYNPTALLNTEGEVVERYGYSAFGQRRMMAPDFTEREESEYDWDFGFQGQFLEEESGYYNYGYRYYAVFLGRWTTRDPIGERDGINLYAFVGNSTPNALDYLGNEKLRIVNGTGVTRGSTNGGGNGERPWIWLPGEPVTTEAQIERFINLGINDFYARWGQPCEWDDYEIESHFAGTPLSLERAKSLLNGGADFYMFVSHGIQWAGGTRVPLHIGERDGKMIGGLFELSEILTDNRRLGPVAYACCFSAGVESGTIERRVINIFESREAVPISHFFDALRLTVYRLCCRNTNGPAQVH